MNEARSTFTLGSMRGPLLVLFAASVTMLSRLWEGDLYRDEVLYAAVAKGIVTGGNWLDLYIGDDPYWRKPPLMFWLAAGMYKFIGISVFSAKFFPALFGVLSCLVLYLLVRRLWGDGIALVAAIVLATTPRFVRTAATFRLDSAVTLFTLLSVFYYVRAAATRHRRDFAVAGATWGLAVMAKGAFGLLAPLVFLVYLAVHRELRLARGRGFFVSLITGAAVCLPWHIYEAWHWGLPFLDTYLGQEVWDRITGELWSGAAPSSYFADLLTDAWPWLAFMALGSGEALRRARRGDRAALFVLCWALGYLLLLHTSQGRRARYLLQFYPPAGILAALAVDRLLPRRWAPYTPRAIAALFAATAFVLLVVPIPIHSYGARDLKALRPVLDLLAPESTTPLAGFRLWSLQARGATLFYLDRDLHNFRRSEIPRDDSTIVLTLTENGAALEAVGFRRLHANDSYALFRPPIPPFESVCAAKPGTASAEAASVVPHPPSHPNRPALGSARGERPLVRGFP